MFPLYSIYKVYNKETGLCYVGSSNNPQRRFREHLSSLRKGKHHSYRLQSDWDLGGDESLAIEIIEENVDPSDKLQREQYWMDYYKSYEELFGYNISPTAGTTLGRRHREQAKIMMSKSHTGKRLSDEHKTKQSEALKGYKKTEEHQRKITEALRKRDKSTYARGSANMGSKLTEKEVMQILSEISQGLRDSVIAKKFNVSRRAINAIRLNQTWKHVPRDEIGATKIEENNESEAV